MTVNRVQHAASKYRKPTTIIRTPTGNKARIRLTEDQIATILEALHDQRDPTGEPADAFEQDLQNIYENLHDYNKRNP